MLSSSAQSDPADAGGVLLARVLQRSCELVWRLPPAGLRDTWRPLVLVIGLAVHVEAASLFGRLAPGLLEDLVTFVRCGRPQPICHLCAIASRRRRSVTVDRVPTASQGGVLPSVAGAAATAQRPRLDRGR